MSPQPDPRSDELVEIGEDVVRKTDKLEAHSAMPASKPTRNVNVPDPEKGSELPAVDGATGHEAFEEAKATSVQRKQPMRLK
ncbi:hypothetical protein [Methylobacterium sp. E-046]|uniref:hypothetical protein n=1 Tax=Methylobacterium sp. E-046 TaxID=2836576 RepID=UPI001FBAE977|nr:hypothetical protein [Methylobacterium sp. E-046]MCJ2100690.1 hypothetical protein [Methylobacterium sp. E-046]